MNKPNIQEFAENVTRIANNIDDVLDTEDVMLCAAALTLVLGHMLADDIIGKYENFTDLDESLMFIISAVRGAYLDCKGTQ